MRFLGKASPAVPLRMPGLLTVGPHDYPGMRGLDQRPGRKSSRFNCVGASPLMADQRCVRRGDSFVLHHDAAVVVRCRAVRADRTLAASPKERTSSAGDDQPVPIDMG